MLSSNQNDSTRADCSFSIGKSDTEPDKTLRIYSDDDKYLDLLLHKISDKDIKIGKKSGKKIKGQ